MTDAPAPDYLVEIEAYGDAGPKTYLVSGMGFTTAPTDDPPNETYRGSLLVPGNFNASLFSFKTTRGRSEVDRGEIVLDNADGHYDDLKEEAVDGRRVTIRRIMPGAPFSSATVIVSGTAVGVESAEASDKLSIRLRDRRLDLDVPVQQNRYGGTTTSGGLAGHLADGTADMQGQVKPGSYGACSFVAILWVNPFDLIGQAADTAVASIVVYDGGIELINAGDFATVELLQAAVLSPGQYATCLALALVRLGGRPQYDVTADVTEGATLADRNASAVVQRLLAKVGISGSDDLDLASFSALAVAAPQEVGIHIDDETSVLDAVSQVLDSIGGFILPDALGKFTVGRFTGPAATAIGEIIVSQIMSQDVVLEANTDSEGLPSWRSIVTYGRVWSPQDTSKLGFTLTADRKAFLSAPTRQVVAENAPTRVRHLLAPEMTFETLLVDKDDADAEAARRLALYSVHRDVLMLSVPAEDADAMLMNTTWTVTYPRHGFDSGKRMVIIGRMDDRENDLVELTLWG